MCGNQTTSETNTNHEQVQMCERDDAKVGSYSSACLGVLDPGPIYRECSTNASPRNVSTHEAISRRISVWCKPLMSDLAFVARTKTCEADLGRLRSSVLRVRHCARRL